MWVYILYYEGIMTCISLLCITTCISILYYKGIMTCFFLDVLQQILAYLPSRAPPVTVRKRGLHGILSKVILYDAADDVIVCGKGGGGSGED